MQYLSGQYLLDPAGPNFHYVWPAAIFFVLGAMLATTYAYAVGETNNKRSPLVRMAGRVQAIAWTLAVIGLILIGIREGDAHVPLVGSRLLLYLAGLGYAVLIVYVAWYLRVRLPKLNAAYESTLLRRQYQPRSRRRR